MDVDQLSCTDLIMSWIEPGHVKLNDHLEKCQRPDHAFKFLTSKDCRHLYDSDDDLRCIDPSDAIREYKLDDVFADVVSLSVSRFVLSEPDRMLRHRCPAPPPKLHYSTQWRNLTRKLYQHSLAVLK